MANLTVLVSHPAFELGRCSGSRCASLAWEPVNLLRWVLALVRYIRVRLWIGLGWSTGVKNRPTGVDLRIYSSQSLFCAPGAIRRSEVGFVPSVRVCTGTRGENWGLSFSTT